MELTMQERKVRTGSHIPKVYDTAQTPCARMLAREDVAEETKKRLLATRAELDMTSLLHENFLCQDPAGSDCPEETTSGHQETWQIHLRF